MGACLSYGGADYLYTEGYRLAADVLIGHIEQTGWDQDTLVYPIVFLYRQHLELALKSIRRQAQLLLDLPSSDGPGHKLDRLWRECRPLLEQLFDDEPVSLQAFEDRIAEFSELDPTSTAFRYPVGLDGRPSVTIRQLALGKLRDTMANLGGLIGGALTGLEVMLEQKQDAEAENRRMREEMEEENRSLQAEIAAEMAAEIYHDGDW